MGILINHDSLPIGIGNGVTIGVIDIVVPLGVNNPCTVCDPIIQDEIICNLTDAWNNNLCPNDFCFNQPVAKGDCLSFQFQYQSTRNAPKPIGIYSTQTTPNFITYGWYHYALNPTNFTIRAKLFNACTGAEFTVPTPTTHNYADDMIQQATVFLDLDRDASSRTLPNQAWYRWVQNINLCLPTTLPTGFPSQFYFMFTITPFTGSAFNIYSQTYEVARCQDTIQFEGVYSTTDCFGYTYSNPSPNLTWFGSPVETNPQPFPRQVLAVNNLIQLRSGQGATYRNLHRFYGNVEQVGHFIEKDIPERQCFSIKTKTYPLFRVRLKPCPPYVAQIWNNNMSGSVALLTGLGNEPTIQVQPQAGADKNNDNSNMWIIDTELRGCDCLDYQQC
jgi:hypothetical protein